MPTSQDKKEANTLSFVVTYKTRYQKKEGIMITLSSGLGERIVVNAIISLPTFREWQKLLDTVFDISYQHAVSCLPSDVIFAKEALVHPMIPNTPGQALVTQLTINNVSTEVLVQLDDRLVINISPRPSTESSICPKPDIE